MYEKGDLAVVVGSTLSESGKSNFTYEIVIVLYVGKFELLVKPEKSRYSFSTKAYITSKHSCQKIHKKYFRTHIPKSFPKPGDLVLECKIEYDKYKVRMGILMEIIDSPGRHMSAKILHDNEYVDVIYKDLMILENELNKDD